MYLKCRRVIKAKLFREKYFWLWTQVSCKNIDLNRQPNYMHCRQIATLQKWYRHEHVFIPFSNQLPDKCFNELQKNCAWVRHSNTFTQCLHFKYTHVIDADQSVLQVKRLFKSEYKTRSGMWLCRGSVEF